MRRDYTIAAAFIPSRVNSKSLTKARRCRASANEPLPVVVSREQVQFAILQFQLPSLCRCVAREFSLLRRSRRLPPISVLQRERRETRPRGKLLSQSPSRRLMHVRRTSGSAFTRVTVAAGDAVGEMRR